MSSGSPLSLTFLAISLLFACKCFDVPCAMSSVTTLSEEPRIEYQPSFLDPDQASALRGLAEALGVKPVRSGETREANAGDEYCVLNRSLAVPGSHESGWAAVKKLQSSSANWSRLPTGKSAPLVTRWDEWSPGTHLNRSGLLHLDGRHRTKNLRTILIYLSGQEKREKRNTENSKVSKEDLRHGLTVFPCVETDDLPIAEVRRRQRLCSRAHRHLKLAHEKLREMHKEGLALPGDQQYAFLESHPELLAMPLPEVDGSFPRNWMWSPEHDAASMGSNTADGSLYDLTEAMCRGTAPGLKVIPVVGDALLIEGGHKTTKGEFNPDWKLFHTGCSPADGHRWTAQVFLDAASNAKSSSGRAEDL